MRLNSPNRMLAAAALVAASAVAVSGQYQLTVTQDRLINAQNEPQNWLLMNGDYGSQRYSKLTQIDRDNVGRLRMVWALALGGMQDTGGNGPENEVNPLIDNGFMYTTDGWGHRLQDRRPQPRPRGVRLDHRPRRGPRDQPPAHARHRAVGRQGAAEPAGRARARPPPRRRRDPLGRRGRRVHRARGAGALPDRAARGRREGAGAERRRRRRHAGLGGGARRRHRRGALALVHGPGARATRQRDLEGRPQRVEDRRGRRLADRLLRPGEQPLHLRHRQPLPHLRRGVPPRRQPVHQLRRRPRRRHRRTALALPVHAERLVGLRRGRRAHAVRHADRRPAAQGGGPLRPATASSTRSIGRPAPSSRDRSTSTS